MALQLNCFFWLKEKHLGSYEVSKCIKDSSFYLSFALYLSKALKYESEGHVEGTTNGLPCSASSFWFSALFFRSSNTNWSWHCAHACTKKWGWHNMIFMVLHGTCSYINTQAFPHLHNVLRPGIFFFLNYLKTLKRYDSYLLNLCPAWLFCSYILHLSPE